MLTRSQIYTEQGCTVLYLGDSRACQGTEGTAQRTEQAPAGFQELQLEQETEKQSPALNIHPHMVEKKSSSRAGETYDETESKGVTEGKQGPRPDLNAWSSN